MPKVERQCLHCGKTFEVYPSAIRKGGGRFCSKGCGTAHRNMTDNPAWRPEVREKISRNHADVSGENNPMYMRRGVTAPSYIDGRDSFKGETYRRILLASGRTSVCEVCGSTEHIHVHHRDGNHVNNDLGNLAWVCVKCHNTVAHKYYRDARGRFVGSKVCHHLKEVV